MIHMKMKTIIAIVTSVVFIMTGISLMAQGPGGPPGPPGGTSGPIDGGVFSLLIGAAVYGYRQLKQHVNRVC